MGRRKLETLDGIGEILKADGSSFGRRRYRLTVWQEVHDLGGEKVDGLKDIEGRVELQGQEGLTLMFETPELTLKLIDGRSLPFFFTKSTGEIAARGPFG